MCDRVETKTCASFTSNLLRFCLIPAQEFAKSRAESQKERALSEKNALNKNLKIQKNYNDTPRFQGINTSCFNWSAFVSTLPLANSII
ncbi:hypothetical protein D3C87_524790 [compost metagenome]